MILPWNLSLMPILDFWWCGDHQQGIASTLFLRRLLILQTTQLSIRFQKFTHWSQTFTLRTKIYPTLCHLEFLLPFWLQIWKISNCPHVLLLLGDFTRIIFNRFRRPLLPIFGINLIRTTFLRDFNAKGLVSKLIIVVTVAWS